MGKAYEIRGNSNIGKNWIYLSRAKLQLILELNLITS